MQPSLDQEIALASITLGKGSHSEGHGMCAMEAAAYLAGLPHSDFPGCVDKTIAAYFRAWNDILPSDAERDLWIKPFLLDILDTKTDDVTQIRRRAFLCADAAVRVFTPILLDRQCLTEHANILRSCDPIVDETTAKAALNTLPFLSDNLIYHVRYAVYHAVYHASLDPTGYTPLVAQYTIMCSRARGEVLKHPIFKEINLRRQMLARQMIGK